MQHPSGTSTIYGRMMKDVNMIIFHQCCPNPETKVYIQKPAFWMTSLDFTSSFTLENVIRCWFRHICGSRGSQQTRLGHGSNGMCPCEGPGISSIEILISQVAVLSSTKKVVKITRNTQILHDWHHGFFVEKPVVFMCFHQFLSISTSWRVEFLCCIDFLTTRRLVHSNQRCGESPSWQRNCWGCINWKHLEQK